MLKESSNKQHNNTYSENTNIAKEKVICKDGFCSLPNQKDISKQAENNMNVFDPCLLYTSPSPRDS